jgi:hypothetical protein
MRVNRYVETDITSAYANWKKYEDHREKLVKIHSEKRDPFKNTPKEPRDLSWSPNRNNSSNNTSITKSNLQGASFILNEGSQERRNAIKEQIIETNEDKEDRTDLSDITPIETAREIDKRKPQFYGTNP